MDTKNIATGESERKIRNEKFEGGGRFFYFPPFLFALKKLRR